MILDIFEFLQWKFKGFYWYLYHRIIQSHLVNTGLPKGQYYDKTSLLPEAMLQIVEDFVSRDKEDAFNIVEFDCEQRYKIIEVLYFKNIRRVELENQYEELLHKCYGNTNIMKVIKEGFDKIKETPEWKEDAQKLRDIEVLKEKELNKILHTVVDLIPYLWS